MTNARIRLSSWARNPYERASSTGSSQYLAVFAVRDVDVWRLAPVQAEEVETESLDAQDGRHRQPLSVAGRQAVYRERDRV